MKAHRMLTLAAIAGLGVALAISATDSLAQQKQRVSYKSSAESSKYTQQHVIDVGDVPGHQVRVFEIYRTYPNNPPVINGVKLKESWTRSISDYTDNNGPANGYAVYVLENGDKFFYRYSGLSQSTGPGKIASTTVGSITGGTGKLVGIQGMIRSTSVAEPKAGMIETQSDIEYWMDK
jgi:hypothetical protein